MKNILSKEDKIYTSDLDVSVTYSDLQKKIIIYKGDVFFRADIADMQKEAKEILRLHQEMIDKENARVNNK